MGKQTMGQIVRARRERLGMSLACVVRMLRDSGDATASHAWLGQIEGDAISSPGARRLALLEDVLGLPRGHLVDKSEAPQ
jgi:transcriptional regulator with XRE-family HTH domain